MRTVLAFGLALLPAAALALGEERLGNEALTEHQGTPLGPAANHAARVYYTWVNGAEDFYYRGDAAALNGFLKAFAAVTGPEGKPSGEVILRPLPGAAETFDGKPVPYDWHMEIYGGISATLVEADRGGDRADAEG